MAFRDLSELLDAGLSLPINGTTYTVPPVDAETGLRLQRLAELAAKAAQTSETGGTNEGLDAVLVNDASEIDLYRDALGPVYQEMVADRVPWPALKIAGITAWLDAAVSRETAEAYWNAAGDPEALAGNRATRRAARSTRQPASANGTTRTRSAAPKRAARSGGRTSSSTGR